GPAPRPVAGRDDDAVLAERRLWREELGRDVREHPLGRPLQRVAPAAPAGVEEEHLPAALHGHAGAEHADVGLLVGAWPRDELLAGAVAAARIAPRAEALAVAEAREDDVAVGVVPHLRHAGRAAVEACAERVLLHPVGVEHDRDEPLLLLYRLVRGARRV